MSGRKSKELGRRVEILCRDWLRRLWPAAYRVGTQMIVKEPDINGTEWWVECKGSATESGLHPWAALRQAMRDRVACKTPDRPIMIYMKASRKPAVVMFLADEWMQREADFAAGRFLGR